MALEIPQEISFMSQTWRIRAARPKELIDCVGQCDPQHNEILLDPTLSPDVILSTLFHEIVHIWEITLHQHLTEGQTDVIAQAMIHCFKTNPSLLALLSTEQEENVSPG